MREVCQDGGAENTELNSAMVEEYIYTCSNSHLKTYLRLAEESYTTKLLDRTIQNHVGRGKRDEECLYKGQCPYKVT